MDETITTAEIFINDSTLNWVETAAAWIYLLIVGIAIPRAAFMAYRNRKAGLTEYRKKHRALADKPHPDYVLATRYSDDEEADAAADRCYDEATGKQFGPHLWMHILLPAIIGTLVGFILMILGNFKRWVDHKSGTWYGSFSDGLPDFVLGGFIVCGVLLALFLPIELANKKENNYFDYVLAIWAAFSVAYAATSFEGL